MAQALIQPAAGGSSPFPQIVAPLFDPRKIRDNRARFRRDQIPELEYANSLYVPGGRGPARGWILIQRSDYDAIAANNQLYATNLALQIDECVPGGQQLTFVDLAIVQARCVTIGLSNDANAIYLVELTDGRGLLKNRWYQQSVIAYYNVRAPAYPLLYYNDSLDSGSQWTWTRMIQDLWEQMTFLGTYPGLPITPTGTPENWVFPGTCCYDALNKVLDHLGCAIAVDLTSTTQQYTIVNNGANDVNFTDLQQVFASVLTDDLQWIDTGSGRVPGSVTVFFHRRNQYYGTEETVRSDLLQWETDPLYTVTIAAPAFFTGAQGEHYIWDDFHVRFDIDGAPLVADVTTATTIATERVRQYYNHIYSGTQGYMRQMYAGLVPFYTGSSCDGVCWKQDFREPMKRSGWRTEICRGTDPLWPEIYGR